MNETESNPSATTLEIEVTRDPAFVRLSADQGVCTFLGHDLELTLLLMSQGVAQQVVTIDGEDVTNKQVSLRRELSEMARIRMSPSTGSEIAFAILQRLLETEIINGDELRSEVEGLLVHSVTVKKGSLQ